MIRRLKETNGNPETQAKPRAARSDTALVHRWLARLLAPDLRAFARALVRGEPLPTAVSTAQDARRRLESVAAARKALPAGPADAITVMGLAALPATPSASNPETEEKALAARRAGLSRRKAALAAGVTVATVRRVLERRGDPAPAEVKERELAAKASYLAALRKSLAAERRREAPDAG